MLTEIFTCTYKVKKVNFEIAELPLIEKIIFIFKNKVII